MAEFTRDMFFGSKPSDNAEEQTTDIVETQTADITEFSIDTITSEILTLKNNISINIIKIGKMLNIVKDNIEYGEFGKWLEEKVDFSQKTAEKFMKIAVEFSESKLPTNLGHEKLYLLAGVETEEREQLMQEYNVSDMTTRELENIIKEKKGIVTEPKSRKFTGKIKKDTYKKYKDRFNTDDDLT